MSTPVGRVSQIYHMGIITMPYYLDVPTADNTTAQLSTFWQAAPGAYVPPFDQFGLDPTSTNITVANPIPVKKNDQTVPIMYWFQIPLPVVPNLPMAGL